MKTTLHIVCMLVAMFIALLIFYFGMVGKPGDSLTKWRKGPIEIGEFMDSPIPFKPVASKMKHSIVHDRKNALFQRRLWRP
ncbi:hypothetical protein SAMN05216436_105230 [bacterium A37T11]|nr:hypothetical protein SAMN05216436_105230 [bacterium A37T11]